MKNKLKLVTFAILLIVFAAAAGAIGITPGRRTIDFEAGKSQDIELTVLNTENKDFEAAIYATGELKEYIKIPESSINFNSGEEKKKISYTITLPDSLGSPGLHSAEIVAREIPSGNSGDTVISTMVAVVSQLHVMVPYPGKYAEAVLTISEIKAGEPINFYVRVSNLGEENIEKAKASIIVIGPDGSTIAQTETDEQPIDAKSRKEVKAILTTSPDPGIYHAISVITYDGKETQAENDFAISDSVSFPIKPLDISVRDFKLGEIAKFNILVENTAKRKINAYSQILLDDKSGKSIADARSADIDIMPKMKEEMVSYWDTAGVEEGQYSGKMILGYENKTEERDVKTTVAKTSIKTEIIGITGHAINVPASSSGKGSIGILVAVLIIINVGWLIYVRRKKK